MNKKGKILVRIFAGLMAGTMVLGSLTSVIYVLINN